MSSRLFVNPSEIELQEESVISIKRVSKATTGGRKMGFNSLVVVGDGNGHVGIGFGKANDVAAAVNKAKEKAKKRIIKAPIINGTIPHRMDIKYGSVRLMIKPAGPGTGIIAGGPVREVLSQLGVKNILTKNTGSTNAINVVRALEHALINMKDPLSVARRRGITIKQLFN
jgi:small subunit ribosomal protein S5